MTTELEPEVNDWFVEETIPDGQGRSLLSGGLYRKRHNRLLQLDACGANG